MRGRHLWFGVGLALAATLGVVRPLAAQGYRGWLQSTARYVELRPIRQDTVDFELVTGQPDGSLSFDGFPVTCVTGVNCTYYRPVAVQGTVALTEDLGFTAWGLGLRGLSVTGLLRARARAGGELIWPRQDDAFDALLAYAQLRRGALRVRLGRMENTSGLGFSSFDGGSVAAVAGPLRLEAFAGRSLARGLREPISDALRGIEDFVPDDDAYLYGTSLQVVLPRASSIALRYQREVFTDPAVLLSERASLDLRTSGLRPLRINGSVDYDVAWKRVGKAHITLQYLPSDASFILELTGRRYVPYFDLSTIWGFFSPVGYHGAEVRGSWALGSGLGLWVAGGLRRYQDASATVVFSPLEDDAWRASGGGNWQVSRAWRLGGSYRIEWGNGAFLNTGDLAVRWAPDKRLNLTGSLTAFQQIEEFRVGENVAWGSGASGSLEVFPGTRLEGGFSLYLHRPENRAVDRDFNQFRAWSSVRIEIGSDPGLRRRGR